MYKKNEPDSFADQRYHDVYNFIMRHDAGCGFNKIKNELELHHDTLEKILDSMEKNKVIRINKSGKPWNIKLVAYETAAEVYRVFIFAIIDYEMEIFPKLNKYRQTESIIHILQIIGVGQLIQYWDYMCGRKALYDYGSQLTLRKIRELTNVIIASMSSLTEKERKQMDLRIMMELQFTTMFLFFKSYGGMQKAITRKTKRYRTKDELLRDIDSVYPHEDAIEDVNNLVKTEAENAKLPYILADFRNFADKNSKQYKKFVKLQKELSECAAELRPDLMNAARKFLISTNYEEQLKVVEQAGVIPSERKAMIDVIEKLHKERN